MRSWACGGRLLQQPPGRPQYLDDYCFPVDSAQEAVVSASSRRTSASVLLELLRTWKEWSADSMTCRVARSPNFAQMGRSSLISANRERLFLLPALRPQR